MLVVAGSIPGRFFLSDGDLTSHTWKKIGTNTILDSGAMLVVVGSIPGRFFLSGGDWRNHGRKFVRILF